MAYRLTAEERETTINFCMADDEVYVDTADSRMIRKFDKLVANYPEVYKCVKVDSAFSAKAYTITSWKYIQFKKPPSQAQREAGRRKARFLRANVVNLLRIESEQHEARKESHV